MDKTKQPPIPDKTSQAAGEKERYEHKEREKETGSTPDPQFVRGTIDPPTKKER